MDNKSDDQLLIIQDTIDSNRQYYDEKTKKQDSKLDKLTAMVENMMDQIQILNYLPDKTNPPKSQDPTTALQANNKAPPLEGENSTKMVVYGH